ncbi:hypothetical protein DICPUDRAFT_78778 [Dictyostelium purpureum]|uniref:Uncharacterized protein n=1 Tax=Dictyostelium purpureum TaxID=5786 RepID=F0ZKJ2_DICPU|nr:uncharacterized protein DICPUDRAFT_78778 [Dictyostelium purpureum]EGC35566.1 hypothetical protein DICPUDRAFT_78778 [Dictyostelium purpureum]|eukprot:XP_003287937.1 hypothetical protein DICPUDRAFT_78778 [Dictyostelium purpureum]
MVGTFLELIHHLSSPKKSPVSQSKRGTYKDLKFHLVGDSAFFSKDSLNHFVNKVNPSKGSNNSDALDLYKLNNSTLKKLCLGLGVSRSSSNKRMVMLICGIDPLSHSTNPNSYSLLSEAIQKDTLKSYSLVKLKNLHQNFNLPAPAQLTCEGYILAKIYFLFIFKSCILTTCHLF